MRLVEADAWGYKRFRDHQKMDLYPSLVCVVGPNAAGKSSFLDALTHLNDDRSFERWEGTRNPAKDIIQVRARFILDDDDKDALVDIPEATAARELVVWKKDDFERGFRLEPVPERNFKERIEARSRLQKLADHKWAQVRELPEGDDDRLSAALAAVRSEEQSLEPDEIQTISFFAGELGADESLPYNFRTLPKRLHDLALEENERHPHDAAIAILRERIPQFTKFDVEDRDLAATYDVDAEPNQAILNLLQFAETSWDELRQIADDDDRGRKVGWQDHVRETLALKLAPTWGQQQLAVRLDLDGRVLKVLMSMQTGELLDIDQHSDGLRQFVALRAYMSIREEVRPIVLIDEAETHLHYDAQADLIRVFEEQRDAAKIIYTTHSAGCLPHDLGTGIRAIVPVYTDPNGSQVQTDASQIENHFWTLGVGFQPLLLVLGAQAFAFASTQRAVVCEGMSDALLLPTLIREAAGADHLPYQFCPGASEASRAQVVDLDLVASRVVFLLDGDGGGRQHARKVKRGGARAEQVIYLGSRTSGLGVEDLVTKEVFLEAVNGALGRGALPDRLAPEDVPDRGRAEALKQWCEAHPATSGKPVALSKTVIAERILDQRYERALLAPRHRKMLLKLDEELRELLALPTHNL